jgi:hypothetical protein
MQLATAHQPPGDVSRLQRRAFSDLAEERLFQTSFAVEFNKCVANRVLPELKALAFGNIGRRQYGFQSTAPALTALAILIAQRRAPKQPSAQYGRRLVTHQ